mgnify:CR=1 FL=1
MPFSSDLRMLISQQSSTTPVRPAESNQYETEVFFFYARNSETQKIIAVDHGYGNMKNSKTSSHQTGIKAYETETNLHREIFWNITAFTTGLAKGHKRIYPG